MFKNHTLILLAVLSIFLQHATCYALSWSENNPDEINPGGSISISIIGNCPPYTWEVNGKGYSIESPVTQEGSNTVNSTEDACGSVTISVGDSCGEKLTEKSTAKSSTNGWWKEKNFCIWNCEEHSECYSLCGAGVSLGNNEYELIRGGKKTFQKTGSHGGCSMPGIQCPPEGDQCSPCNEVTAPNCIDPRWEPESPYLCKQVDDTTSSGERISVTCYEARVLRYYEWVCPGVDLEFPPGSENDDCKQYQ